MFFLGLLTPGETAYNYRSISNTRPSYRGGFAAYSVTIIQWDVYVQEELGEEYSHLFVFDYFSHKIQNLVD